MKRLLRLLAASAILLAPGSATPLPFRVGEVEGLFDLTLAYGILARVEGRNGNLIGIGNGGKAPSVNGDDGNLNYGVGIVSNAVQASGDLTLRWRNFGAFVRGLGFYDFETDLSNRARTDLNNDSKDIVGLRAEFQDYYLAARFQPRGMPVQLRVGNQVVNWGESGFLRFGVDVVNPVDLVALFLPTTSDRDVFIRQGMLWGVANPTETLAVEAFYQYQWEPVRLAPTGWFPSTNDLIGGDGIRSGMEGFGQFSDQGTDLDAAFGLPAGTLGFDPDFMRIPSAKRKTPSDQGQYGFTLQAFVPALNASKLALHFVNYHSRFPLISGLTADPLTISRTTDAAVEARALALSADTGLPVSQTRPAAEHLTVSDTANRTRYFASYPEDIRMLGLSFNTATTRTGTLVAGEVSHHFDWPVQTFTEEVLNASLSPIEFTDVFKQTSLGVFGPSQVVKGFNRSGKTQLSLGLAQLFGPRLGAAQSLLSFDIGWVHIHDLPGTSAFDADSWGYRLVAGLSYDGLFGGISVQPRALWTHDVDGNTPSPATAFIQDRKTFTAALRVDYTRTWTLDLSYTTIFGSSFFNAARDRDFLRFRVSFNY